MGIYLQGHSVDHNGISFTCKPPWVRIKVDTTPRTSVFISTSSNIFTSDSAKWGAYCLSDGEELEIPLDEETTLYAIHEWSNTGPSTRLYTIRYV